MKKLCPWKVVENTSDGVKVLSACKTRKGMERMYSVYRNRGVVCEMVTPIVFLEPQVGIINCTPHAVVLIAEERRVSIPPSGYVARVSTERLPRGRIGQWPIVRARPGEITGLPNAGNVLYIVSAMVLAAGRETNSLLIAPDTENAVRSPDGRIIGVPGFVC